MVDLLASTTTQSADGDQADGDQANGDQAGRGGSLARRDLCDHFELDNPG